MKNYTELIPDNFIAEYISDKNGTLWAHLGDSFYRHGLDIITLKELIDSNEELITDELSVCKFIEKFILDKTYYLAYVHYDEDLDEEVLNGLLRNPDYNYYESSTAEAFVEQRSDTCHEETMRAIESARELFEDSIFSDSTLIACKYDWNAKKSLPTNELTSWTSSWLEDYVLDCIYERDDSDELKNLLHNTREVMIRGIVSWPEDSTELDSDVTAKDILSSLNLNQDNTPSDADIEHELGAILEETRLNSYNLSSYSIQLMAYINPSDLYDLRYNQEYITLKNYYIVVFDPSQGTGDICEVPINTPITLHRSRVSTDNYGPGYGINDTFGLYSGAFTRAELEGCGFLDLTIDRTTSYLQPFPLY